MGRKREGEGSLWEKERCGKKERKGYLEGESKERSRGHRWQRRRWQQTLSQEYIVRIKEQKISVQINWQVFSADKLTRTMAKSTTQTLTTKWKVEEIKINKWVTP